MKKIFLLIIIMLFIFILASVLANIKNEKKELNSITQNIADEINGEIIPDANNNLKDAILNKEEALKIGRTLLEEHFPDFFLREDSDFDDEDMITDKKYFPELYLGKETPLDAIEKDGIWIIYNIIGNRVREMENGNYITLKGGEYSIELRKIDGEILKISVD